MMGSNRYASYQSDFAKRYVAEGEAKGRTQGKADAVLAVLRARGMRPRAAVEHCIAACADIAQLDDWIRRAATIASADELLDSVEPAYQALEALTDTGRYEYQSDLAKRHVAEGEAKGRAQGKADAVLAVLRARGLHPTAAVEQHLTSCAGIAQLDGWIRRAATAESIDDLLESLKAGHPALKAPRHAGRYEYQSDFAKRYVAEGKATGRAEGKAEALLVFLRARGMRLTAVAEQRITACTDIAQLDDWLRRAVTVDSTDELFD